MAENTEAGRQVKQSSIRLIELANELSLGDPRQLIGSLMLAAGSSALGLGMTQKSATEKFASGLELLERAMARQVDGSDAFN